MKNIIERLESKHREFIKLRPEFSKELEKNLYDWFRVALTYTSNAIEGNTLSHVETAQVIEKEITVQGKTVTEHLEAIDHAHAIDFAKDSAKIKTRQNIELSDILAIHKLILRRTIIIK